MTQTDDISHIINKKMPIDAVPIVIESEPLLPAIVTTGNDIQDDYELARQTLRDLVTK